MDSDLPQKFAQLHIGDYDVEFNEAISKYPSSFDLEMPKSRLQTILHTLVGKLENGFVLVEEIQVCNLLSYLSFKLGKIEDALGYNEQALRNDRRNGIALANRARFKRFQHNFFDADKDLETLAQLYSNETAAVTTKLIADGEIAQSYARFGPKFHEKAISKYEHLLQNRSHIHQNVVILWKYDYCLCLRRTLNVFNKQEYPERDLAETARKACVTLSEIIDSTANLQVYTGRSWVELGQIVYSAERNPDTYGPHMLEAIPIQKRYPSSKMYFDKALEYGMEDFDTMEVCAKFLLYFGLPEESVRMFERALVYRQTSLAYHHMALALKSIEVRKANELHYQQRLQDQSGHGRRSQRNLTQTPRQKQQYNLKRFIKCGRKATPLPWNDQTKEIVKCLEMAYEKDPLNHPASYDKVFVLRHLGRTKDAKTEICKLLNRLDICELKVSCYEQAAYCCLDLADASSQESEKHKHDAILFLQKAIQVAAAVAARVKYSSADVRPLIPTVKSMLVDPALCQSTNRQLYRLQTLLKEHGRRLPVVQEASSDQDCIISELLDKCVREGRVDDAALLSIFEEIGERDETNFTERLTTIVTSASTYLANGEREPALTMYQIFYRLLRLRICEEDTEYDAFLMTDQESENLQPMYQVSNWLKNWCGLNVVNSEDNCTIGEQILHSLTNLVQKSGSVLLVFKEKKIIPVVEHVTSSIISQGTPKLVILKDEVVELRAAWINVPTVTLPRSQESYTDSDISTWLTDLFKAVMK